MKNGMPIINGLVLAGGKSLRMGHDKGAISLNGKEQKYYMADLLKPFCSEVFLSQRADQDNGHNHSYQTITDAYTGIGPYGGILSAFKFKPESAWLVVACDLPLLDKKSLAYLLENRDIHSIGTTFQSPFDGLPEPLVTIWEPQSYAVLLGFLAEGITCPRKALIRSGNAHILQPPEPIALMNVNTPEDFKKAEQIILKKRESHHGR
jgi:molybdopterin-guanine dinucleotide biosynthesis protein A